MGRENGRPSNSPRSAAEKMMAAAAITIMAASWITSRTRLCHSGATHTTDDISAPPDPGPTANGANRDSDVRDTPAERSALTLKRIELAFIAIATVSALAFGYRQTAINEQLAKLQQLQVDVARASADATLRQQIAEYQAVLRSSDMLRQLGAVWALRQSGPEHAGILTMSLTSQFPRVANTAAIQIRSSVRAADYAHLDSDPQRSLEETVEEYVAMHERAAVPGDHARKPTLAEDIVRDVLAVIRDNPVPGRAALGDGFYTVEPERRVEVVKRAIWLLHIMFPFAASYSPAGYGHDTKLYYFMPSESRGLSPVRIAMATMNVLLDGGYVSVEQKGKPDQVSLGALKLVLEFTQAQRLTSYEKSMGSRFEPALLWSIGPLVAMNDLRSAELGFFGAPPGGELIDIPGWTGVQGLSERLQGLVVRGASTLESRSAALMALCIILDRAVELDAVALWKESWARVPVDERTGFSTAPRRTWCCLPRGLPKYGSRRRRLTNAGRACADTTPRDRDER